MFRTILFATDLSNASERAVDCVATWKAVGLEEVVVAHVHNIRHSGGLEDALRADHEPKLAAQASRLQAAGLAASWRLAFGVPYLDVDRLAHEARADAVVVGSHGATWVKEILLGSVADGILRRSTLPVLVIKVNRLVSLPAPECRQFCGGLFGRVLFATDFSDASEDALEVVERMAAATHPVVHLVHVQELSRIVPHLEDRLAHFDHVDNERLHRIADALRQAGAREVTQEIRLDHAGRGILRAAEAWRPHLIVVGSQGRGRIAEALLGGTAHHVARLSPDPVLVVPMPRRPAWDDGRA